MRVLDFLRHILGLQVIRVDSPVYAELQNLAERERRTKEAVAADLLAGALVQRRAAEINLRRWQGLSGREQDVAALICLGYTNAEIAARLSLALPTVKYHVRNVLYKFELERRAELRLALSEWDFGAWRRGGE